MIIILRGTPASGKTTVGKRLVSRIKKMSNGKVAFISVDEVRHFDMRVSHPKYVYGLAQANALICANNFVQNGFNVIVEGVFISKKDIVAVKKLINAKTKLHIFTLVTPALEAEKRAEKQKQKRKYLKGAYANFEIFGDVIYTSKKNAGQVTAELFKQIINRKQ